jgi:hypothetical protein
MINEVIAPRLGMRPEMGTWPCFLHSRNVIGSFRQGGQMHRLDATMQMIPKRLSAFSIAGLLACVLAACGMKEESAPESSKPVTPTPVFQPAKPPGGAFDKYSEIAEEPAAQAESARKAAKRAPASANGDPPAKSASEYMVKLGVDPVLRIPGPPGELKVWIGLPAYEPAYTSMATQTDTLPAKGKTAKVKPFAPGLKVEPDASICMKTNPRGSEVRFMLTPSDAGTFKVGADVALFDSGDCSGAPIPKATTTLRVDVSVDRMKLTAKYMTELWDVFWKKLLEFWGGVLALFFAALLFLFRKKLKKWFGYTD